MHSLKTNFSAIGSSSSLRAKANLLPSKPVFRPLAVRPLPGVPTPRTLAGGGGGGNGIRNNSGGGGGDGGSGDGSSGKSSCVSGLRGHGSSGHKKSLSSICLFFGCYHLHQPRGGLCSCLHPVLSAVSWLLPAYAICTQLS